MGRDSDQPWRSNDDSGSVLILSLWSLFFLAALAVAMSAHVGAGLKFASWHKTATTASCLAMAGVEKAAMDISADTNLWDGVSESWYGDEHLYKDVPFEGGAFSIVSVVETSDGSWVTNNGLTDEESRINISKASSEVLAGLLITAGGLAVSSAREVAACIADWRDKDETVTAGGAEAEYYVGLSQPLRCHNDAFQSIYELLLVKGMSRDLFEKIEPFVTIYGSGRININTAGPSVLTALGVACGGGVSTSASLAGKISGLRDAGRSLEGGTVPDAVRQLAGIARLSADEESLFSKIIQSATLQSSCFRGVAEGNVNATDGSSEGASSVATARITFVVERKTGRKLYWHEE